jgi:hypothetical protein
VVANSKLKYHTQKREVPPGRRGQRTYASIGFPFFFFAVFSEKAGKNKHCLPEIVNHIFSCSISTFTDIVRCSNCTANRQRGRQLRRQQNWLPNHFAVLAEVLCPIPVEQTPPIFFACSALEPRLFPGFCRDGSCVCVLCRTEMTTKRPSSGRIDTAVGTGTGIDGSQWASDEYA